MEASRSDDNLRALTPPVGPEHSYNSMSETLLDDRMADPTSIGIRIQEKLTPAQLLEFMEAVTEDRDSDSDGDIVIHRRHLSHLQREHPFIARVIHMSEILFHYAFSTSLFIQLLQLGIWFALNPNLFDGNPIEYHNSYDAMVSLSVIIQLIQVLVIVMATFNMLRYIKLTLAHPVYLFKMYLANILLFMGLYSLCYLSTEKAFFIPDIRTNKETFKSKPHDAWFAFMYFSVTTMTSTGYGDMVPTRWPSQLLAVIQMGAGLMYTIGFFGIGLNHFRMNDRKPSRSNSAEHGMAPRPRGLVSRCLKWFRVNVPGFERLRKILIKYLLFFTLLLQVASILLIVNSNSNVFREQNDTEKKIIIGSFSMQTVQFVLIFSMSLRLVQKTKNKEVSPSFLVQSYLSTCVLFAGIYFNMFLVKKKLFDILGGKLLEPDTSILGVLWRFMYFSMTTQTTTGYGDIFPLQWESRLVVAFHLIISQLYVIVILGLGLAAFIDKLNKRVARLRQAVRFSNL